MLVGEGQDLVALVPILISSLVKEDAERALSVLVLQRLRCEGNAQDSSDSAADESSRVGVVDDFHHGGTDETLGSALDPVHGGVLDLVLFEDGEDGRVGVSAGLLSCGTGEDRDPNDDVLVQDGLAIPVGNREADGNHRRDVNVAFLLCKEVNDGGANLLPPQVGSEDGVEYTMSSPIGNGSMLVFKRGKDEGMHPDVRALQEVGMLLGNALIEESLLEGRGRVWVDDGGVGR